MKCSKCLNEAEYVCRSCKYTPLCSNHFNLHKKIMGEHAYEACNLILSLGESWNLQKEILSRMEKIKSSKLEILSYARKLIIEIKDNSLLAIKELEGIGQFYSMLLSTKSFSKSLKEQALKIISSEMIVKNLPADIDLPIKEIFLKNLVNYTDVQNIKPAIPRTRLENKNFNTIEKFQLVKDPNQPIISEVKNKPKKAEKIDFKAVQIPFQFKSINLQNYCYECNKKPFRDLFLSFVCCTEVKCSVCKRLHHKDCCSNYKNNMNCKCPYCPNVVKLSEELTFKCNKDGIICIVCLRPGVHESCKGLLDYKEN